jgi:nicotinate-nucleotide adenylyltransferase
MRIGLFGGSFNPPHVCHTIATLWALQTCRLDEVLWIPTYQHAFDKSLAPFEQREEMCRRAVEPIDGARVDPIERTLGGESRTIDTVRALEERRPSADYALIIGSDILEEVDQWKAWDELVERTELIVIGRAGFEADETESTRDHDFELPNISSSRTREALAERDRAWLETWIPASVLEFIDEHDLYR